MARWQRPKKIFVLHFKLRPHGDPLDVGLNQDSRSLGLAEDRCYDRQGSRTRQLPYAPRDVEGALQITGRQSPSHAAKTTPVGTCPHGRMSRCDFRLTNCRIGERAMKNNRRTKPESQTLQAVTSKKTVPAAKPGMARKLHSSGNERATIVATL
jgi:hypothetical protein